MDPKQLTKDDVVKIVQDFLKTSAFTDRKLTDVPTDPYQVVPRNYVTANGSVAGRPSIAVLGQPYLATDTRIPMTYTQAGWVNGVGSIVAS
jgi:hypothetical protein